MTLHKNDQSPRPQKRRRKVSYWWMARIKHEGRLHHLGYFLEEEAAARAFDEGARRLRGDQAHGGRSATGGPFYVNVNLRM